MSLERLPRIVRATIDLYELNRRVLEGDVTLDWSDVQSVDHDALLRNDPDPRPYEEVPPEDFSSNPTKRWAARMTWPRPRLAD